MSKSMVGVLPDSESRHRRQTSRLGVQKSNSAEEDRILSKMLVDTKKKAANMAKGGGRAPSRRTKKGNGGKPKAATAARQQSVCDLTVDADEDEQARPTDPATTETDAYDDANDANDDANREHDEESDEEDEEDESWDPKSEKRDRYEDEDDEDGGEGGAVSGSGRRRGGSSGSAQSVGKSQPQQTVSGGVASVGGGVGCVTLRGRSAESLPTIYTVTPLLSLPQPGGYASALAPPSRNYASALTAFQNSVTGRSAMSISNLIDPPNAGLDAIAAAAALDLDFDTQYLFQ